MLGSDELDPYMLKNSCIFWKLTCPLHVVIFSTPTKTIFMTNIYLTQGFEKNDLDGKNLIFAELQLRRIHVVKIFLNLFI